MMRAGSAKKSKLLLVCSQKCIFFIQSFSFRRGHIGKRADQVSCKCTIFYDVIFVTILIIGHSWDFWTKWLLICLVSGLLRLQEEGA